MGLHSYITLLGNVVSFHILDTVRYERAPTAVGLAADALMQKAGCLVLASWQARVTGHWDLAGQCPEVGRAVKSSGVS